MYSILKYVINTIDILVNKCIIDYKIDLDISNKRSNFSEIIANLILHKNGLPLYLLGLYFIISYQIKISFCSLKYINILN